MFQTNKKLTGIFEDIAAIYRFKGDENRFRVRAYEKAARVLDHLNDDVSHYMSDDQLEDIPGIGESIAAKIREFVKTGKIEKYEELKKEIPADFIDLLNVKGLGPRTLKTFRDELGITTRGELVEALKDGRIGSLEGFREKTVKNILEGLHEQEKAEKRILLNEALEISDWLITKLKVCPGIEKIDVAGSIRRGRETIGDIDLLVSSPQKKRSEIIDFFTSMSGVRKVLAKGGTKASVVIDQNHRQVDLRLINKDQWGAALLYFTGSKDHNIHLRQIARDRGLKINEYGLYRLKGNKKIAGETEEGLYHKLGLEWIPPELRENDGEIEAAQKRLPALVEPDDIKGDLHVHSNWSDGTNDIGELALYVRDHLGYDYFVLTDHSQSSRIARGLNELRFREQFGVIDEINRKIGKPIIKKGVELDILPDGTLDLPDDLLEQMDWVVASVHSLFTRDNTNRILAACESPYVNAIGHPSGRLIGKRKAYPLDYEKVIKAAAATGTVLEINAQPERMDLSAEWVKLARDHHVMLQIGTDSHDLKSFGYMKAGVTIARRGWCRKDDIVNTKKWREIETLIKTKRKKIKKHAFSFI